MLQKKKKRKDTNELNYKTKHTDLENKFVVQIYADSKGIFLTSSAPISSLWLAYVQ